MPTPYELQPIYEGDRFSASQWSDILMPLQHRTAEPQDGFVDSLGSVHSSPITRKFKLIGAIADEDCAGWKEVFHIRLGIWSGSEHDWEYEEEDTVHAIDLRYDVPYPEECSTGLVTPRSSDEYGIIYEVVAWDCSPPPC